MFLSCRVFTLLLRGTQRKQWLQPMVEHILFKHFTKEHKNRVTKIQFTNIICAQQYQI